MDRPLSTATLMLGVLLGTFVGIAYAVARRSWADYRKARATIPGLRKAAWGFTRLATTKAGIVLLLCLAAAGWAAAGGDH